MEKIAAPFDGKNLIDDNLRDEVFQGCYECADMTSRMGHLLGHVSVDTYDEDGIFLDCIVDAQWSAMSNTIRLELKACPTTTDFFSMRDDFFRYYEGIFREWETGLKENCVEPDTAEVEFKRDGNVLYVSFWWINN